MIPVFERDNCDRFLKKRKYWFKQCL
jgi:hypothetical protein